MNINYFNFRGIRSDNMGLLIAEKNIYSAPQRDIELVDVPGRNGAVLIDHGGWKNVDVSYTVQFVGLPETAGELRQWLQGTEYGILKDSYQPEYFRYGVFTSQMNPDEIARNVGRLQAVFSCKPYMYRNDGNTAAVITASGSNIYNPEQYCSEPYIRINGKGDVVLHIGSKSYPINGINGYIEIDSELMCAHKLGVPCNDKIGFTEFPILEPGINTIQWTGDVSQVVIKPKWRKI